jgi:hypothetical protein
MNYKIKSFDYDIKRNKSKALGSLIGHLANETMLITYIEKTISEKDNISSIVNAISHYTQTNKLPIIVINLIKENIILFMESDIMILDILGNYNLYKIYKTNINKIINEQKKNIVENINSYEVLNLIDSFKIDSIENIEKSINNSNPEGTRNTCETIILNAIILKACTNFNINKPDKIDEFKNNIKLLQENNIISELYNVIVKIFYEKSKEITEEFDAPFAAKILLKLQ